MFSPCIISHKEVGNVLIIPTLLVLAANNWHGIDKSGKQTLATGWKIEGWKIDMAEVKWNAGQKTT